MESMTTTPKTDSVPAIIDRNRSAAVIRIALPWIAETIAIFERVVGLDQGVSPMDQWVRVSAAQARLPALYGIEGLYTPHLRVSMEGAVSLKETVDRAELEARAAFGAEGLSAATMLALRMQTQGFLDILKSELGTVPAYLVQPKGSHDIDILTRRGEAIFPAGTATKVPEAIADMREAAKALAFELPTACGFHVFRVLEAVTRAYWTHASRGKPTPEPGTIGRIAGEMRQKDIGDEGVREALSQIVRLHRNPLIHPEVILTPDEALSVIGITHSVISVMNREIPDAPPTTGA